MKIVQHGKLKGLDRDFNVYVDSFEEVEKLHNDLLSKGYLFMYRRGNLPFEKVDKFTILHYINKSLMLYDFGIMFPETSEKQENYPKSELTLKIDKAYKEANKDVKPRLMLFMKHYTRLMSFVKHMIAYNKELLEGEYKERFNKEIKFINKDIIEIDNDEPSLTNIKKIMNDIFNILLPEYS